METVSFKVIAHISSPFPEKFGVPRQSGLASSLVSKIVFEPEYRSIDAFRGIEQYSHLWLIWQFSETKNDLFSPTVRPPKLGGNKRMGVFATRSPFRPNNIGLSCVQLDKVEFDSILGPVIYVKGADLINNTPILDVKPYVPYADCKTQAKGGFALDGEKAKLKVEFKSELLSALPSELKEGAIELLEQDPRPGYHHSEDRLYFLRLYDYEIAFYVRQNIVEVESVEKHNSEV